jgi:hypothetical protein
MPKSKTIHPCDKCESIATQIYPEYKLCENHYREVNLIEVNKVFMEWIRISDNLPNAGQTVLLLWRNGVELGRLPLNEAERLLHVKRFPNVGDMRFFILKSGDIMLPFEASHYIEIPEIPILCDLTQSQ